MKLSLLPVLWGLSTSSMSALPSTMLDAAPPRVCEEGSPNARRVVTRLVSATTEPLTTVRQQYSVPAVDSSAVEVLSVEKDAAACAQLREFINTQVTRRASRVPSFYKAGGFYYVVFSFVQDNRPVPPGHARIRQGWSTLYVFGPDTKLRTVLSL